jgi:processing peptidase subunit alpha
MFTADAIIPAEKSIYVGGSLQKVIPKPPPTHMNDMPPLTYVQVAFPAPGYAHPDMFPLSTLQMIMGGGGSFSAGGPGKGMYSRLYLNVLNHYGAFEMCQNFHHTYVDHSLFGIAAAVNPKFNSKVLDVIIGEMLHMSFNLSAEEISRAKNQLKSSLLMNLESQLVTLEDVGRQVLAQGKRMEPAEIVRAIDEVNQDDIVRVAEALVSGIPTCVGVGENLKGLGSVEETLSSFRKPRNAKANWRLW